MGCDGGTIPTRDELVRMKKKPEKKDQDVERATKWKLCSISQEALRPPIVSCELGRLYNKESVLEYLLDKSKFQSTDKFDHIRGLKDVKELQLTTNPAFRETADKGGCFVDRSISQYICPITGLEMSGRYRFVYLHSCGCVFSERAVKEVKSETCTKCAKPCSSSDVIVINGSEEDVTALTTAMNQRRLLAKQNKKKHKLESTVTNNASSEDTPGPSTSKMAKKEEDQKSTMNGMDKVATKNVSWSKLPAKGAAKTDSKVSKTETKAEKSEKTKSIQNDPNASKAYKDLFNTCQAARNQPKGHWVTHNPLFY